jgi:hypothetical protein
MPANIGPGVVTHCSLRFVGGNGIKVKGFLNPETTTPQPEEP